MLLHRHNFCCYCFYFKLINFGKKQSVLLLKKKYEEQSPPKCCQRGSTVSSMNAGVSRPPWGSGPVPAHIRQPWRYMGSQWLRFGGPGSLIGKIRHCFCSELLLVTLHLPARMFLEGIAAGRRVGVRRTQLEGSHGPCLSSRTWGVLGMCERLSESWVSPRLGQEVSPVTK